MIDPKDPRVQHFVEQGYRLAAHCYLAAGRLKFTFVAKHEADGRVVQGWSRGGTADDALNDLVKRGGEIN